MFNRISRLNDDFEFVVYEKERTLLKRELNITDILLDGVKIEDTGEDRWGNIISSFARLEVVAGETVDGVSIDWVLDRCKNLLCKIYHDDGERSEIIFSGILNKKRSSVGSYRRTHLLHFTGGLNRMDISSRSMGDLQYTNRHAHIVDNILPAIFNRMNIHSGDYDIQSPEMVLPDEKWFTIGTPSSFIEEVVSGKRPESIVYDTNRELLYIAIGDGVYSFNPDDRTWRYMFKVNPSDEIEHPVIVHLEIDGDRDYILGAVKSRYNDPYISNYGAVGTFEWQLPSDVESVEISDVFTHQFEEMYIRSSLVKWQSIHLPGEEKLLTGQAVGWVNAKSHSGMGIPQAEPIPVTLTCRNIFGEGSTVLRVESDDGFEVGMRIGACLVDDHSNFSDLGRITYIGSDAEGTLLYFEYPTRYSYIEEETFVFQLKQPGFTDNIFIPTRMEVDCIYDKRSYERKLSVEVFRRKGFSGKDDSFVPSRIGELPMVLEPGFYAFLSMASLYDDHKHNPYACPFFIRLKSRKNDFFSLAEGIYIRSDEQGNSLDGLPLGEDVPEQRLHREGYGDIYSSRGGFYPLITDRDRVIVCDNGFIHDGDLGYSGVERRARIVSLHLSARRGEAKVLWEDDTGTIEFSAPPICVDGKLHISMRRFRRDLKPLNRRIVGVDPLVEGEDIPYGYSACNRSAVKVYLRGDQTDMVREGSLVSLANEGEEPGRREYVVQGVEVQNLMDHYFCYMDEKSEELVTRLYLVESEIDFPWETLRLWQVKNDDSFDAPPPHTFEQMFNAYLDGEGFKRKYREGLEDEFCGKYIYRVLVEEPVGAVWSKFDLQNEVYDEVTTIAELRNEDICATVGENTELATVELSDRGIKVDTLSVSLNAMELEVVDRGYTPVVEFSLPAGDEVYLTRDEKDGEIQYILVFHPNYKDTQFSISYEYYDEETTISHFAVVDDDVCAFITNPLRTVRLSRIDSPPKCIRDDELGADDITAEGDYLITAPSGILMRRDKRHPGYVEDFEMTDDPVGDLAELAMNFDMTLYQNPEGKVDFLRRCVHRRVVRVSSDEILDIELEDELTPPGVRVVYSGGELVRGGRVNAVDISAGYLRSVEEAEWLAGRVARRLSGKFISVVVLFSVDLRVGDIMRLDGEILSPGGISKHSLRDGSSVMAEVTTVLYDISAETKTIRAVVMESEDLLTGISMQGGFFHP